MLGMIHEMVGTLIKEAPPGSSRDDVPRTLLPLSAENELIEHAIRFGNQATLSTNVFDGSQFFPQEKIALDGSGRVFFTGALENIVAELVELSGNVVADNGKKKIRPHEHHHCGVSRL